MTTETKHQKQKLSQAEQPLRSFTKKLRERAAGGGGAALPAGHAHVPPILGTGHLGFVARQPARQTCATCRDGMTGGCQGQAQEGLLVSLTDPHGRGPWATGQVLGKALPAACGTHTRRGLPHTASQTPGRQEHRALLGAETGLGTLAALAPALR